MPKAMDPNANHEIWLESDADKPADTRPVFVCRPLTGYDQMRIADVQDSLDGAPGFRHGMESVFTALRIAIIDWRNMTWPDSPSLPEGAKAGDPMPFAQGRFEYLLDATEAVQLLAKVLGLGKASDDEAKKSESLSPSSTASSADPVPQVAVETVLTDPAQS
jgi:hypothetical protein